MAQETQNQKNGKKASTFTYNLPNQVQQLPLQKRKKKNNANALSR